jgi:hypothetical protein
MVNSTARVELGAAGTGTARREAVDIPPRSAGTMTRRCCGPALLGRGREIDSLYKLPISQPLVLLDFFR